MHYFIMPAEDDGIGRDRGATANRQPADFILPAPKFLPCFPIEAKKRRPLSAEIDPFVDRGRGAAGGGFNFNRASFLTIGQVDDVQFPIATGQKTMTLNDGR